MTNVQTVVEPRDKATKRWVHLTDPGVRRIIKTRQLVDRYHDDGKSVPLSVLIEVMRKLFDKFNDPTLTEQERLQYGREAVVVAKEAAPYMHPKPIAVPEADPGTGGHERWLERLVAAGLLSGPAPELGLPAPSAPQHVDNAAPAREQSETIDGASD